MALLRIAAHGENIKQMDFSVNFTIVPNFSILGGLIPTTLGCFLSILVFVVLVWLLLLRLYFLEAGRVPGFRNLFFSSW